MVSESCPEGVLCISSPLIGLCILALIFYFFYDRLRNDGSVVKYIPSEKPAAAKTEEDKDNKDKFYHKRISLEPTEDSNNNVQYVYAPRITSAVPVRQINIPTRGPVPDYQQIGILTDEKHAKILPLYGRPTYNGSTQWNYFTSTDKFNQIPLPIHAGSRNCTNDQCSELNDDDSVNVPAYGHDKFRLTLYHLDAPRYIPFV